MPCDGSGCAAWMFAQYRGQRRKGQSVPVLKAALDHQIERAFAAIERLQLLSSGPPRSVHAMAVVHGLAKLSKLNGKLEAIADHLEEASKAASYQPGSLRSYDGNPKRPNRRR